MGCREFALTTPRDPLREGFFTIYNMGIRKLSGEYQEKFQLILWRFFSILMAEGIAAHFTIGIPLKHCTLRM